MYGGQPLHTRCLLSKPKQLVIVKLLENEPSFHSIKSYTSCIQMNSSTWNESLDLMRFSFGTIVSRRKDTFNSPHL